MEWMLMNMDRFYSPAVQLGRFCDDKYIPAKNCQAKIDEILRRLDQDKARWHFRRSLFMNKIISQNLLPSLIHVKDEPEVLGSTLKVLQELMTPAECLIPVESMGRNGEGRRITQELESSILLHKKMFLDTRVTKAIVDLMGSILQDSKEQSPSECECINNCLLLVRNLLHVSSNGQQRQQQQQQHQQRQQNKQQSRHSTEKRSNSSSSSSSSSGSSISSDSESSPATGNSGSKVNSAGNAGSKVSSAVVLLEDQIMWNLFAQRFDNILIKLLTSHQQQLWNITIVQLVSLMYRDQKQENIRNMINEWLDSSFSESSEDDENNTMSTYSDNVSTFDPVSDSSERLSPVNELTKLEDKTNKNKTSNASNLPNELSQTATNKLQNIDSGFCSSFQPSGSNHDSAPEEAKIQSSKADQGNGDMNDLNNKDLQVKDETLEDLNKEDLQVKDETLKDKQTDEDLEIEMEKPSDMAVAEITEQQKDNLSNSGFTQLTQDSLVDCVSQRISTCSNVTTSVTQELAEIKRRPPNETAATTTSDENKPPPQLPKLHKKNPGTGTKRSRHSMSQKLSETQENDFSNSTGSDCDEGPASKRPHHQKPHKMLSKPRPAKMVQKALQERNVKRTKLLKRKESHSIKAKALLHHHPTSEDITMLLKEFTVDFMLKGYANLVQGLRLQVLVPYQLDLDKSHVLWLITYFIRFAVELDLEISQLCPVLSVDNVSYLVYEGIVMQEDLEHAAHSGETNLQPHVRRLHLVVTALREFFIAFELCMKKDPASYDSQHLLQIKEDLGQLVEVRQLFLLLIRTYRPGVFNVNYLQDVIMTNHRFLTTQESASPLLPSSNTFDIFNHVKQFCTMEIMRHYGRLLENFENNDDQVNDCIFTMMHHVVGDLRAINVLLQPQILKILLKIWKEGFDLCVDWADLIEYVLRKCTRVRNESHRDENRTESEKLLMMNTGIELTDEDLDHWYSLYSVQENEADLMDKIKEVCCDDEIEEPIKKEVIQNLLARGFITSTECIKLCAEIPSPPASEAETGVSLNSDHMQVSMIDMEVLSTGTQDQEDSQHLPPAKKCRREDKENLIHSNKMTELGKNMGSLADINCENSLLSNHEGPWEDNTNVMGFITKLKEEGLGTHVEWLQRQLLEACYAKLNIVGPNLPKPEPVASHFTVSNQSIPLIPWTLDQDLVLSNPWFRQLLGELGFHLSNDTGQIFPRIPHFWTPDVLFLMAKRLGDIEPRSVAPLVWTKAQLICRCLARVSQMENNLVTAQWKTTAPVFLAQIPHHWTETGSSVSRQ